MSHKLFIATGLGILMVGAGVWIARGPLFGDARKGKREERDAAGAQVELVELAGRLRVATADLERVRGEKAEAVQRAEGLEAEMAALTAKLSARDAPEGEEGPETGGAGPPIAFGKWADLDAIQNADWNEMAEAVENIHAFLLDVVEAVENGDPVSAELRDKIQKENHKLVRYAAQVMGKIPTHSPINGEFSHPITLANLMGAMLDRAGVPLTDEQKRTVAQIGNEYEREYDRLESTYADDTVGLEKLIDELELKRNTVNLMQDSFTDVQYDTLVHPATHHRLQADTLSPFTMAILLARAQTASSVDQVRTRISEYTTEKLGIDPETSGSLKTIVDSWMEDLGPILEPVERADKFLHLDPAIVAGRAKARALAELLSLPQLDPKVRTAILSDISWAVPQIVQESPKVDSSG